MSPKDLYFFLAKKIRYSERRYKNYFRVRPRNFRTIACERWALKEIQRKIIEKPNRSVITTLEQLREDLDDYACMAQTAVANEQFSTAYDICTDILDMVIVGERSYRHDKTRSN